MAYIVIDMIILTVLVKFTHFGIWKTHSEHESVLSSVGKIYYIYVLYCTALYCTVLFYIFT